MTEDLNCVHKNWLSSPSKSNFFVAATPEGDVSVACMAFKEKDEEDSTVELHRVYVRSDARR